MELETQNLLKQLQLFKKLITKASAIIMRHQQSKHHTDCYTLKITFKVQIQWQPDTSISPSLTDRVKVLHPTRHRKGHFRVVLPSQSLGLVVKKLLKQT